MGKTKGYRSNKDGQCPSSCQRHPSIPDPKPRPFPLLTHQTPEDAQRRGISGAANDGPNLDASPERILTFGTSPSKHILNQNASLSKYNDPSPPETAEPHSPQAAPRKTNITKTEQAQTSTQSDEAPKRASSVKTVLHVFTRQT